jgi:hypothetical protein
MIESEIGQRIQLEAPKHDCILLRNNSGAFVDQTGRMVSASDLVPFLRSMTRR